MTKKIFFSLLGGMPFALMAFSTGPPIKRTGAVIDGGVNCTACHRTYAPANSDPQGSVSLDAAAYTPGVKQTIHVTVKHPEAARWGFQLTARLVSDQSKEAGTLAPVDPAMVKIMCDDGSTLGSAGPCNGTREFAEHVSAPRTDAGAGFTFDVDWTPPAAGAGDVVFYFAGNAANGNGSPTGDRIYTGAKTVSPAGACNYTSKPAISGVVSAASFTKSLGSGACWTIAGSNFQKAGQNRGIVQGDLVSNSLPTALSCVAVEVNGKRASIIYVQQDQINLQAPALPGSGPANVTVILNPGQPNEIRSDAASVTTQAVAPALFTFDGKSVAAQFTGSAAIAADPAVVSGARAAKPGELITLYGTGLGPTDPPVDAGALDSGIANVTSPVTITIGGVTLAPADVLYVGLVPGSVSALYQLDVRVPTSAGDGNLPVVVSVDGNQSQSGVTLAVKSGS